MTKRKKPEDYPDLYMTDESVCSDFEVLPDGQGASNDYCVNCRRCAHTSVLATHSVILRAVDCSDLYANCYSRRCATICKSVLTPGNSLTLCANCEAYLSYKEANVPWKFEYPAYLWKFVLANQRVVSSNGGEKIWSLIASTMRPWWVMAVREMLGGSYRSISLDSPSPVVADVTERKGELVTAIKDGKLGELMRALDDHLLPLVRCPWGCSEYFHKATDIPFDAIMAQLLGPGVRLLGNSSKINRFRSMRQDFGHGGQMNWLLGNDKWVVSPSVAVDMECGLAFLACRDHKGGTTSAYLHPPLNPCGSLPDVGSDQIAPVIVVPRMLRSSRASEYSNTYQMNEMRGHYGGIDTMVLVDTPRFERCSVLGSQLEAFAIKGRPDVKTHITRSLRGETSSIPGWLSGEMLRNSEDVVGPMEQHKDCWTGATYIDLEDSVRMQEALKGETVIVVDVADGGSGTRVCKQIVPPWPSFVLRIHPPDRRGERFSKLPSFPSSPGAPDYRIAWALVALHVALPALWESTFQSVRSDDGWEGWLLQYVNQKCFAGRHRRRSGYNPFRFNKACDQRLLDMLKNSALSPEYSLYANGQEFTQLFASRDSVQILYDDIRSSMISAQATVIIVCRDAVSTPDIGHQFPPERVGNYELRFICVTKTSAVASKWSGSVLCRHGRGLDKWWIAPDRRSGFEPVQTRDERVLCFKQWGICAYVKMSSVGRELKKRFIAGIGGQTKAFCRNHEVPLIVSPYFDNKTCCCLTAEQCTGICGKRAILECPVSDCDTYICKSHHDGIRSGETTFFSGVVDASSIDDESQGSVSDSVLGGSSFSTVHVSEAASRVSTSDASSSGSLSTVYDQTPSEFSGDSSALVNAMGNLEFSDNDESEDSWIAVPNDCDEPDVLGGSDSVVEPVFKGEFEFDDDNYITEYPTGYQSDLSDASSSDTVLPTTASGAAAGKVSLDRRSAFVPGHVLLNNCGTMLSRRAGKLTGTTKQRNFIQRIASIDAGESIPLAYPEAVLYPSIFWKSIDGGSVLGAMPCGMLGEDSHTRRFGLASVGEHLRCRITNPSLLCSTDNRYKYFAFDEMANNALRKEDSRVVLHRGFVKEGRYGVKAAGEEKTFFYTDMTDNRPVVHRLAAAVAEEQATYFFTHTCSMKDHFGIRRLKDWIDSDECMEYHCNSRGIDRTEDRHDVKRSIVESANVVLLRNWMETSELYMSYIAKSDEHPLGRVTKMWWRHEYQDSAGNLSHIHALVWNDDSDPAITLDRIRGSISELIRTDEIGGLVERGIIDSPDDVPRVRETGLRNLRHRCSNRCKKRVGLKDGEERCRVANVLHESLNPGRHTMKELRIDHSEAAEKVLLRAGLLRTVEDKCTSTEPINDALRAVKHYPPACAGEGIISPCNGVLFAATLSHQNLQLCTSYTSSRYLAKYVAGIDEHNRVNVGAAAWNPRSFTVHTAYVCNTKVTGSKIKEKERENAERGGKYARGRALSLMETIALICGYEQVHSTIHFVHVPTIAYEERPGFECEPNLVRLAKGDSTLLAGGNLDSHRDIDVRKEVEGYKVRKSIRCLPTWRQFSTSEILTIRDRIRAPHTIDAVTAFSIRPPELRFVRSTAKYFRWFVREGSLGLSFAETVEHLECELDGNYGRCAWYDGTNCRIRVRWAALREVVGYVENCPGSYFCDDPRTSPLIRSQVVGRLFTDLVEYVQGVATGGRRLRDLAKKADRFLAEEGVLDVSSGRNFLPTIWHNNVRPSNPARFLHHILLSLGEFTNELDLLGSGSLRDAFGRAGLYDSNDPDASIVSLTRRYILEQLMFIPCGSQQFDRYCLEAHTAFDSILRNDRVAAIDIPPVLFTKLREKCSADSLRYIQEQQRQLLRTILDSLNRENVQGLPSVEELALSTLGIPYDGNIDLLRSVRQSEASHEEQLLASERIDDALDSYIAATQFSVKNLCIAGGPGCGKTFLIQLAALRSRARGLNVGLTAWMSERALQLGGMHAHKMFCIPVKAGCPVVKLAEFAFLAIIRKPKMYAYVRSMQVLVIDELGQISAEALAVLDILLRRVRGCTQFMGGLLVFCSMDVLQLPPIRGTPPLLSSHMLTSFHIHVLQHSVRAGSDPILREIQSITRLPVDRMSRSVRDRFCTLVRDNCSFHGDWNDGIAPHQLRVFGTKEAVRIGEQRMLEGIRSRFRTQGSLMKAVAQDEESTVDGRWQPASTATKRKLTRQVKEPETLYIYPYALYEITFNKDGRFSCSQLAVICEEDMPENESKLRRFEPLVVVVAPEGCKEVPQVIKSRDQLIQLGWVTQLVGAAPLRPVDLRGISRIQGRRKQYGLKHRIASTIHGVMGQNLGSLVTKISQREVDPTYGLWLQEQVIVLMSRTTKAKDVHFVGDAYDTAKVLWEVLSKRSQYSDYIGHLLGAMSGRTASLPVGYAVVDLMEHPFRPVDVDLPTDATGYAYMLVSVRHPSVFYFGETQDLSRRLHQHNAGVGARQTSDERLRPWALYCFVCGFDRRKNLMRLFENMWRNKRECYRHVSGSFGGADKMVDLAAAVLVELESAQDGAPFDLRLVRCGSVDGKIWITHYRSLRVYLNGGRSVEDLMVGDDRVLSHWVREQLSAHAAGLLNDERVARLRALGVID